MKVRRPAWRVRRSCASRAPAALAEMSSRMRPKVSGGAASSMRPPTDSFIKPQPDQRMLRATKAARRLFHQPPAGPEKVEGHQGRKRRVKNRPASHGNERHANKNAA